MHRACRPGGPLESMKWYDFALTNHDFLLAAMIICVDAMDAMGNIPSAPASAGYSLDGLDKFDAIKRSRSIWAEIIDYCKDAKRAVKILDGVIRKLTTKVEEERRQWEGQIKPPISVSATNPNVDLLRYEPYFTDQFGLGMPLVAGPPNGEDTLMQDGLLSSGGIIDSLGSNMNLPADFNWVSSDCPSS